MQFNVIKAAQKNSILFSKIVVAIFIFVFLSFPFNQIEAGSLTSIKDTLSTSRPSVYTAITGSVSAGDTAIPVTNTAGILQGDNVTLCTTAACTTSEIRVVASIVSNTQLALTVGTTNPYTVSSFVIYKAISKHTITVVPRSTVTGGKFVVTLPGDATPNDSIPASGGFDFNKITTADVTLSPGTIGTVATSTPGGAVVFTIPFTGTIASGTAQTITIGNTNLLLSPTKTAAQGTADTFTVQVDETDSGTNVIDTTQARVATIESVTVSAVVVPSLNFTINAVAQSTTVAGVSTDVASTATTVPFGNLTVATNRTVAQYLHIDTNSNSGYIITAQSDGSLRKTNGTVITDFSLTPADNVANSGFGYALQTKAGAPTFPNQYNTSGSFWSQGFNSSTPVTVMSNGAPANGDEGYVAYRVRTTASQAQGNYQNIITFIATATY